MMPHACESTDSQMHGFDKLRLRTSLLEGKPQHYLKVTKALGQTKESISVTPESFECAHACSLCSHKRGIFETL